MPKESIALALGLDFMVDQDLTPYLLEANTGPVLKEDDDSDMQMVQVSVRTQSCFASLFREPVWSAAGVGGAFVRHERVPSRQRHAGERSGACDRLRAT